MKFFIAATMIVSCSAGASASDLGLIDAAILKDTPSRRTVLDARPGADWKAGHILGARSFSRDNYTRTDENGVQYNSLPPREPDAALAVPGVDGKIPVAVYGDADKSWGI
jgi:thiosulfate/3-mercaptopyruvate sulfurtransferase